MAARPAPPLVPVAAQRKLLLGAQDLLVDPARRSGAASVRRGIEKLGYVQIDTIHVVERAHHHILFSRFDGYRPATLTRLLERDRVLFEHWTHDACAIPVRDFRYWHHRFVRYRAAMDKRPYWKKRLQGRKNVLAEVRDRLVREGPLRSADFENDTRRGSWWDWKPQKAALEYLWRIGEVTVSARQKFQKLYDLTERVFPEPLAEPRPDDVEHVDWACAGAMDRLVVANAREIREFYQVLTPAEVKEWLARSVANGELVPVRLEAADDSKPKPGFARPDWERRAKRFPDACTRTRVLSPFDPAIRERDRTSRVFGFDYRFEAFVPAPKRKYGYFVLPILEGDRLVGRVDPKLHRDRGELVVRGPWWEQGVRPTAKRRKALAAALDVYAEQLGAASWSFAPP